MVRRARDADLAVLALTDHDSTAGVAEAQAEAVLLGVRVISACEFSVKASWGEVHVLAYFLPPDDSDLQQFLEGWQQARRRRGAEMARRLSEHGVAVTFQMICEQAGSGTVGRVHVAQTLVRVGAATDVNNAFDRWIGRGKPGYVKKQLPTMGELAAVVRPMGGVLVAAHLGARGTLEHVEELYRQGLDGIEVRHPSHDARTERRLRRVAERCGLAMTGGSDWHGDVSWRQPYVPIGGNRIPLDWLEQLEERRDTTARGG